MNLSEAFRVQTLAPAGAALAVLAAVTAASLSKTGEEDEIIVSPVSHSPDATPRLSNADASGEDAAGPASQPDDRPLAPEATPDPQPEPDPQVRAPAVRSPASSSLEIVVGMSQGGEAKAIAEAYFRDPAQAQRLYAAFQRKNPAFSGLALDRATYSNELVLTPTRAMPSGKELSGLRDLAAKLSASPGVAYAEPNMIAKPGLK